MKIHYLNLKGEEKMLDGIVHLQNVDNQTFHALTKSGRELSLHVDRIEGIADMVELSERVEQLESENFSLRARLEKAVNKRVVANMLAKYFDCPCNFSPIDEEMFDFCNECCNDNVICWEKVIEKSNAEARLAELKGEEKNG